MNGLKSKIIFLDILRKLPLLVISLTFIIAIFSSANSQSITHCSSMSCSTNKVTLDYQCGTSPAVQTSINFNCDPNIANPITALIFAIIKFLSDGIGLVIIASIIVGGIQYIVSRGEPAGTQAAIKRITSSFVALLVFIFAYAILNYVIPMGVFNH